MKQKNVKERSRKNRQTMAGNADRHVLYEKSVQCVATEYRFVNKTFRKLRKRRARHLREDFCGTAGMCCEWVRRKEDNTAVGVDIDADVLEWGRQHNLSSLKSADRMRVSLVQQDVCQVATPEPVDIVLAMNFSYQVFKTREKLGGYFRSVYEGLADDGILIIDAFGGYDSYREIKEKRKFKGFRYIWEHARYDPISGAILCHIHFSFPDGSKLRKAFTYDWRLWTLPELQELLNGAGFSRVQVYWEGTDEETGEGNGKYAPAAVGQADPGWVCFLVAEK